jgi:hypothetical protein
MKENMEHCVHMCIKCQNTKAMHNKKFGLFEPPNFDKFVWECLNGIYDMCPIVAR